MTGRGDVEAVRRALTAGMADSDIESVVPIIVPRAVKRGPTTRAFGLILAGLFLLGGKSEAGCIAILLAIIVVVLSCAYLMDYLERREKERKSRIEEEFSEEVHRSFMDEYQMLKKKVSALGTASEILLNSRESGYDLHEDFTDSRDRQKEYYGQKGIFLGEVHLGHARPAELYLLTDGSLIRVMRTERSSGSRYGYNWYRESIASVGEMDPSRLSVDEKLQVLGALRARLRSLEE